MRLFSDRSQITSKCGKNKKVAHEAQPSVSQGDILIYAKVVFSNGGLMFSLSTGFLAFNYIPFSPLENSVRMKVRVTRKHFKCLERNRKE